MPVRLFRASILSVWLCSFAGPAVAQPPASIAGTWSGAMRFSGVTLEMRVVFTDTASGLAATMDIPQQGAAALALTNITRDGARLRFELPTAGAAAYFDGTIEGETIAGTFSQGPAKGTFSLSRARAPAQPAERPPYAEHEVTFQNGSVTLAGTLTIPEGSGPFPAVVFITGSGAQTRDEEVFGFKVFQRLADALTRQGIAVLRYDDRGAGQSTGVLLQSTTSDFAGDALAGLALAASRPEIAPGSVGLLGHSEGAAVAVLAASRSTDVAFVVMLAGTGAAGGVVLRGQAADAVRMAGGSEATIARVVAAHDRVLESIASGAPDADKRAAVRALIVAQIEAAPPAQQAAIGDREAYVERLLTPTVTQMSTPWMRDMISFDPSTALARVTVPVLAIFGGKDMQVRPSLNRPPIEAALKGRARSRVVEYPDANHLFQAAKTGWITEYAALEKAFVPGLTDEIAAWIHTVSGR